MSKKIDKKQEIAEKVKEIHERQKNWLKQRDEEKKSTKNSKTHFQDNGKNHRDLNEKHSKERRASKSLEKDMVQNIHSSSTSGPSHRSSNPKGKFKHWLKAQESKAHDTENEDRFSSSHDKNVSNLPLVSHSTSDVKGEIGDRERSSIFNSLISPQDFDEMADRVVARVKEQYHPDSSLSQLREKTFTMNSHGDGSKKKHESDDTKNNAKKDEAKQVSISSHYCPGCSKLMVSPANIPMLCIPCGHNICQNCAKNASPSCVTCNATVMSHTINMMLLQIIEGYHKLKKDVRETINKAYSPQMYMSPDYQSRKVNYKEKIENLQTRDEVLHQEMRSVKKNLEETENDLRKNKLKLTNIDRQENKILNEIKTLEDTLKTLRHHKQEYRDGEKKLKSKHEEEKNKLHMIQDSLLSIEIEMEKMQLLSGKG